MPGYDGRDGQRSPFPAYATALPVKYLSLVYFNRPGWAKKQLKIGEPRVVSGRMELYGQELQIVHPDYVLAPDEAATLPESEPVYPLSEGLTNNRMGHLAGQALARVPELAEWVEPSVLNRRAWPGWAGIGRAHV